MGKDKHKISNWRQYSNGLKQRGSLLLWFSDEVKGNWEYAGEVKRGGQQRYSDVAIGLCLAVRKAYRLPLRQTQGFVESILAIAGLPVTVPDYSTLSRRSSGLDVGLPAVGNGTVTDIVVDSTGLKVYGEGEWKVRKHGAGRHRTWMKLHIACDASTQQVEAVVLSTNAVDDASGVGPLLEQIGHPINSFRGDGAYDKAKVRRLLHGKGIKQVIPPQHNAVKSKGNAGWLQQRDTDIEAIAVMGRSEWKKRSGYHQRSRAETAMFRYKAIIGGHLASRKMENQVTEVRVGCQILNRFLQVAKPLSYKVA